MPKRLVCAIQPQALTANKHVRMNVSYFLIVPHTLNWWTLVRDIKHTFEFGKRLKVRCSLGVVYAQIVSNMCKTALVKLSVQHVMDPPRSNVATSPTNNNQEKRVKQDSIQNPYYSHIHTATQIHAKIRTQ